MGTINPTDVLKILMDVPNTRNTKQTHINGHEVELKKHLESINDTWVQSPDFHSETNCDLDLDDEQCDPAIKIEVISDIEEETRDGEAGSPAAVASPNVSETELPSQSSDLNTAKKFEMYDSFVPYLFTGIPDTCVQSPDFHIEKNWNLEVDNEHHEPVIKIEVISDIDEDTHDGGEESLATVSSPNISETEPPSPSSYLSTTKEFKEYIPFDYKKRAVEFWKSGKKKNYSFSTVQRRFKKLKCREMLYVWSKQVENKGTRRDKLFSIYNETLKEFVEAKSKKLIVHDSDIRKWALNANREVALENFTASAKWIHNFKKASGIVLRKQKTKFVTTSCNVDSEST